MERSGPMCAKVRADGIRKCPPKTSAAFSGNSVFHAVTWFGCTSWWVGISLQPSSRRGYVSRKFQTRQAQARSDDCPTQGQDLTSGIGALDVRN